MADTDIVERAVPWLREYAKEQAEEVVGIAPQDIIFWDIAAALEQQSTEIAKMRQIVSHCASAIGNGAFCAPDAPIEFMGHLPSGIKLVAERKDAEIALLTAQVAELEAEARDLTTCCDWLRKHIALEDGALPPSPDTKE